MTAPTYSKPAELALAREYYARGIPSELPSTNRYKFDAESHRWGRHRGGCPDWCPIGGDAK